MSIDQGNFNEVPEDPSVGIDEEGATLNDLKLMLREMHPTRNSLIWSSRVGLLAGGIWGLSILAVSTVVTGKPAAELSLLALAGQTISHAVISYPLIRLLEISESNSQGDNFSAEQAIDFYINPHTP